MNVNVSPEQERAKLTNLETAAAEENAPIQASCEPDSDRDLMCSTPSLKLHPSFKHSFDKLSLGDLVTGSLMRTYFNVVKTGADVTQSLNERPHEPSTAQPNARPPEDDADVILSERDLFESPVSDDSESTIDTAQLDNKSEGNASSGSSVVTDTPVVVVKSKCTLKTPKLKQIIRNGKDIKLKSKEMKLRGKHNPTLHFKIVPHAFSLESGSSQYIALYADIDVPQNYNHILDTAKFNIFITLTDNSASNTPLPLPRPQSQSFSLAQEDKHMVFQLFPHSFALNSTRSSVNVAIEVQLLYYLPPEEKVPDYEVKNHSDGDDCVDIQKKSVALVRAEWTVSVTNDKDTIKWKEQGLTLHVPKDSLPVGCQHTQVTMVVDRRNQAQGGHTRRTLYGLECIDEEKPKVTLDLTTHHGAVDVPS